MALEEFEKQGGGLVLTASVTKTTEIPFPPGVDLSIGCQGHTVRTPTTNLGHLFPRQPSNQGRLFMISEYKKILLVSYTGTFMLTFKCKNGFKTFFQVSFHVQYCLNFFQISIYKSTVLDLFII